MDGEHVGMPNLRMGRSIGHGGAERIMPAMGRKHCSTQTVNDTIG